MADFQSSYCSTILQIVWIERKFSMTQWHDIKFCFSWILTKRQENCDTQFKITMFNHFVIICSLVCLTVRSDESNLDINCPHSWKAFEMLKYKCSYLNDKWSETYKDCLFCLTCVRNLTHLGSVEICVVTLPRMVHHLDTSKKLWFGPEKESIKDLHGTAHQISYCGMSLLNITYEL